MAPGSRKNVAWPPHVVRRHARIAAFVPLLMVGIGVLGTNPDWFPAALILGALTVALAIAVLISTATKGWVFFAGLILGLAVTLGAGLVFQAALMQSQGQRTEVRITSVRTTEGKTGPIYHCRLKRTDGKPMDHADIVGVGCDGTEAACSHNVSSSTATSTRLATHGHVSWRTTNMCRPPEGTSTSTRCGFA